MPTLTKNIITILFVLAAAAVLVGGVFWYADLIRDPYRGKVVRAPEKIISPETVVDPAVITAGRNWYDKTNEDGNLVFNEDGAITRVYGLENLVYLADNGDYQKIDTTVAQSEGEFKYENTTNTIKTFYKEGSEGGAVKVQAAGGQAISFNYVNAAISEPRASENSVLYPEIYPGMDARYYVGTDRITEEVVVKAKTEISDLSQTVSLEGLYYLEHDDGSITFHDNETKNLVMTMPRPLMYETTLQSREPSLEAGSPINFSLGLHFEIVKNGDTLTVTKVIDQGGQEWLKKAAYPVAIDLTLTYSTSAENLQGTVTAGSALNYMPISVPPTYSQTVWTGYETKIFEASRSGGSGNQRVLLNFNTGTSAPAGTVVGGRLNLNMWGTSCYRSGYGRQARPFTTANGDVDLGVHGTHDLWTNTDFTPANAAALWAKTTAGAAGVVSLGNIDMAPYIDNTTCTLNSFYDPVPVNTLTGHNCVDYCTANCCRDNPSWGGCPAGNVANGVCWADTVRYANCANGRCLRQHTFTGTSFIQYSGLGRTQFIFDSAAFPNVGAHLGVYIYGFNSLNTDGQSMTPTLEVFYLLQPTITVDPQGMTSDYVMQVNITDNADDETSWRVERSFTAGTGPWTEICGRNVARTATSGSCGAGVTFNCSGTTKTGINGTCIILDDFMVTTPNGRYGDRHAWYRVRTERDETPADYLSAYSTVADDYTLAVIIPNPPDAWGNESWKRIRLGFPDIFSFGVNEYNNQGSYPTSDPEPTKYCVGLKTASLYPSFINATAGTRYTDYPTASAVPSRYSWLFLKDGTVNAHDLVNNTIGTAYPATTGDGPRCATFYNWIFDAGDFNVAGEYSANPKMKPGGYFLAGVFSQNTRDKTVNSPDILNNVEVYTRARTPSAPALISATFNSLTVRMDTTPSDPDNDDTGYNVSPYVNTPWTLYAMQICRESATPGTCADAWQYLDPTGGSTRYGTVQWGCDANSHSTCPATHWNGASGRTITGLTGATCYLLRAQSANGVDNTLVGESTNATTLWSKTNAQLCTPLNAPAAPDVRCNYNTTDGYYCDVTIRDTLNPSPPYFYKVQRSYNGTSGWTDVQGYVPGGALGTYNAQNWSQTFQNAGTVRFKNLACTDVNNSRLYFQVFASRDGNNATTSNSVASPIKDDMLPPCRPSTPTLFAGANPKGHNFIKWNWATPYARDPEGVYQADFFSTPTTYSDITPTGNIPWTQPNLNPNQSYTISVRGCDNGNVSNGNVERCGQWSGNSSSIVTYAAQPNIAVACNHVDGASTFVDDYYCDLTITEQSPENPSTNTFYQISYCVNSFADDCETGTWVALGWSPKTWTGSYVYHFEDDFNPWTQCSLANTYQYYKVEVRNTVPEITPQIFFIPPSDTLPPCQPTFSTPNHINQTTNSLQWQWIAPSGGAAVVDYTGSYNQYCRSTPLSFTTPAASRLYVHSSNDGNAGTSDANLQCTISVRARDSRGRLGRSNPMSGSVGAYTSIEPVASIQFTGVQTNQMSIRAIPSGSVFNNLATLNSGISFTNNPTAPGGGAHAGFSNNATPYITSDSVTDSGLSPNRNYCYQARSANADRLVNGTGDINADAGNACRYTLAAIPAVPILVRSELGTSAKVTLRTTDGNPQGGAGIPETQYALCVTKYDGDGNAVFERYARTDGSIDMSGGDFQCVSGDTSGIWGTYSQWGSTNGITIPLDPSSKYDFAMKARNGDGPTIVGSGCVSGDTCIETAFGPKATLFLVRNNIVGWAWSSNVGWLSLNCLNLYNLIGFGYSCGTADDWGVNTNYEDARSVNPLGGYAWSASGQSIGAGICQGGADDGETCFAYSECAAPGVCEGLHEATTYDLPTTQTLMDFEYDTRTAGGPFAWALDSVWPNNAGQNDYLRKINLATSPVTEVGNLLVANDALTDMEIDKNGNIWIASYYLNKVYVINPTNLGIVSTIDITGCKVGVAGATRDCNPAYIVNADNGTNSGDMFIMNQEAGDSNGTVQRIRISDYKQINCDGTDLGLGTATKCDVMNQPSNAYYDAPSDLVLVFNEYNRSISRIIVSGTGAGTVQTAFLPATYHYAYGGFARVGSKLYVAHSTQTGHLGHCSDNSSISCSLDAACTPGLCLNEGDLNSAVYTLINIDSNKNISFFLPAEFNQYFYPGGFASDGEFLWMSDQNSIGTCQSDHSIACKSNSDCGAGGTCQNRQARVVAINESTLQVVRDYVIAPSLDGGIETKFVDGSIWVGTRGGFLTKIPIELKKVGVTTGLGWVSFYAKACSNDSQKACTIHEDCGTSNWVDTGNLVNAMEVPSLAYDPTSEIIYAATSVNGDVFMTASGGTTWTNTGNLNDGTTDANAVKSLLRTTDGTLYAGARHDSSLIARVYKSTDNGATWTVTGAMAPQPQDVLSLLEASDGTLYAGTYGNGDVFKSTNGGATWINTGNIQDGATNAVGVLDLIQTADGTLYAGARGEGNVFKSVDGGTTWTNTGNIQAGGISAIWIPTLIEASDGTLYAGTRQNGGATGMVFKSTDGGTSWNATTAFPSPPSGVTVYSLLEDGEGSIFAGVWSSDPSGAAVVYKSRDKGASWVAIGDLGTAGGVYDLLEVNSGRMYASTTPFGNVYAFSGPLCSESAGTPPDATLYGFCYTNNLVTGEKYGKCSTDSAFGCTESDVTLCPSSAQARCIFNSCKTGDTCPDVGASIEECRASSTASFSGITREVTGWARILSLKSGGEVLGYNDWGWIQLGGSYDDGASQSGRYTVSGTEIDSQQFLGDPDVNPTDVSLYTLFGWGWQAVQTNYASKSYWLPPFNVSQSGEAVSHPMALDSIGNPHVAWIGIDGYYCNNNQTQSCSTDAECGAGKCTANQEVYYARYDVPAGQWVDIDYATDNDPTNHLIVPNQRIITAGRNCLSTTDVNLSIDTNDRPHLLWAEEDCNIENNYNGLYYVQWDGTAWKEIANAAACPPAGWLKSPLCISAAEDAKMVLDRYNMPHVAWGSSAYYIGEIQYRHWDGTNWVTVSGDINNTNLQVDNLPIKSEKPSLAVSNETVPRPHIAWHEVNNTSSPIDEGDVYYRFWDPTANSNAGGWVDANPADGDYNDDINVSNIPNEAPCSAGGFLRGGRFPALALDSNNVPNIAYKAYKCNGGSDNTNLYLRKWDGSTWATVSGAVGQGHVGANLSVDGVLATPFQKYDVPSLVMDTSNRPHLTWSDGNSDIYYRYWNGTGWVTASQDAGNIYKNVSNSTGDSLHSSLQLDRFGNPHVAWWERQKNASQSCGTSGNKTDATCIGTSYPFCMDDYNNPVGNQVCNRADIMYTKWAPGNVQSGVGWIEFIPASALLGIPYVQTSFGDVYAGNNVTLAPPPAGSNQYTATYLIQANGDIQGIPGNYASSQTGLPTSQLRESGLNPLLSGAGQPFGANVLSRLDIDSLITSTGGGKNRFGHDINTLTIGDLGDGSHLGATPVLNGEVYYVNGNASINTAMTITKGTSSAGTTGNGVVIIDGNLEINAPVLYDNTVLTDISEMPSAAFIVRGNITVNSLVTNLAGVFVAIDRDPDDGLPSGIISTGRKNPVSYAVATAQDDTTALSTGANAPTSTTASFGVNASGQAIRTFLRYQMPDVPAGAEIRRAYLRFDSTGLTSGGDFTGRIYLMDSNNVGSVNFTNNPNVPLYDYIVSNSISYDTTGWNVPNTNESPDITSLVKRFMNDESYAPTNYIGLVLHEGDAAANEFKTFAAQDHLSLAAPELIIEYAPQRTVYTVANAADDVAAWGTGINYSVNPPCMSVGWYSSNPNRVYLRFTPQAGKTTVPESAQIVGAHLIVQGNACNGGNAAYQLRQGLLDEDDMPVIGGNPFDYALSQDVSEVAEDLVAGAWGTGSVHWLADSTSLIQSWVDRTGYAAGNHVGIRLRRGGNETFAGLNETRPINPLTSEFHIDYQSPLYVSGLFIASGYNFDRTYTKNLEGAEQIVYDGRVVANTPPGLADFTRALPLYQRVVP